MEWSRLLSEKRIRQHSHSSGDTHAKDRFDLRSEFEKDYHRIIGSASFRRLQDKTQVFPLDQSDFIRTRLTHSLEVASFGKSLGHNIAENILACHLDPSFTPQMKEDICHILECAGLIHDIGNPPFGHFGEEAIRDWFSQNLSKLRFSETPVDQLLTPQMCQDLIHFEGNAQALRLVTKLHYLVDEHGMNLTFALLNTIIKYPIPSTDIQPDSENLLKQKKVQGTFSSYVWQHKMGYYLAEQPIFEAIVSETGCGHHRHPLTFILEAADDLAYKTADIEDAFVKGFLSYRMLFEELVQLEARFPDHSFPGSQALETLYHRGLGKKVRNPESYAVKNWIIQIQGFLIQCATQGFTMHYTAIMNGTFCQDLYYETAGCHLMDFLGDVAFRYVFSSSQIYQMEMRESVILNFLLDKFVQATLYYDTPQPLGTIDKRYLSLISDNYKTAYLYHSKDCSPSEKLYLRLLLVTDYICGMTDSYAMRLYKELNLII